MRLIIKLISGDGRTRVEEIEAPGPLETGELLIMLGVMQEGQVDCPCLAVCGTRILRLRDPIGEPCEIKILPPFSGG
jgi:molybdopterin converting factor small subunit